MAWYWWILLAAVIGGGLFYLMTLKEEASEISEVAVGDPAPPVNPDKSAPPAPIDETRN